jgi:hypothetical protein
MTKNLKKKCMNWKEKVMKGNIEKDMGYVGKVCHDRLENILQKP